MPRVAHVHNQTPPAPPDTCEIVLFAVAVVPYALAALETRIPSYIWSEEGYLRGNQLIRSLQMSLLCGGLKEITDRQDQLYRLMSGALYGTEYSIVSTDPELVIEPPIQAFHSLDFENENSMLGRMEDSRQLLQNALNGTETALYDRPLGVRDLLELIQAAVEASDDLDPEMLAKLTEIAAVLL
jgi:hypothetical protein